MNSISDRMRGVTLIELLIVIAIVGVLAMVGFPSISRYLETQRIKGVASEMLEDLQFARAETVARQRSVGLKFNSNASQSCYTLAIISDGNCATAGAFGDMMSNCNCLNGASTACAAGRWTEIKTVSLPVSRAVDVRNEPTSRSAVAFDPTSGNVTYCFANLVGFVPDQFVARAKGSSTSGEVRVEVGATGRAKSCKAAGALSGVPAC